VDADGDTIDVTPDREQVKAVFDAYEPGAGERLDDYLAQSRENYEVGMEHFVYEDRPGFGTGSTRTSRSTPAGSPCSGRCRITSRTTSTTRNSSR